MTRKGFRFFADDEDEFELEDLLQALCFLEGGPAWVPSKPWEPSVPGKWVQDLSLLPEQAQRHLIRLLKL